MGDEKEETKKEEVLLTATSTDVPIEMGTATDVPVELPVEDMTEETSQPIPDLPEPNPVEPLESLPEQPKKDPFELGPNDKVVVVNGRKLIEVLDIFTGCTSHKCDEKGNLLILP